MRSGECDAHRGGGAVGLHADLTRPDDSGDASLGERGADLRMGGPTGLVSEWNRVTMRVMSTMTGGRARGGVDGIAHRGDAGTAVEGGGLARLDRGGDANGGGDGGHRYRFVRRRARGRVRRGTVTSGMMPACSRVLRQHDPDPIRLVCTRSHNFHQITSLNHKNTPKDGMNHPTHLVYKHNNYEKLKFLILVELGVGHLPVRIYLLHHPRAGQRVEVARVPALAPVPHRLLALDAARRPRGSAFMSG